MEDRECGGGRAALTSLTSPAAHRKSPGRVGPDLWPCPSYTAENHRSLQTQKCSVRNASDLQVTCHSHLAVVRQESHRRDPGSYERLTGVKSLSLKPLFLNMNDGSKGGNFSRESLFFLVDLVHPFAEPTVGHHESNHGQLAMSSGEGGDQQLC